MTRLAILALIGLSGCCYTHYEDGRIAVSRLAVGVDSQASRIWVTCATNSTTVRVGEVEQAGAKAAGTIIGTAVRGAL